MSKFNLKSYEKTNGDQHITMKLKEQHVEPANTITEQQLEDRRVPEKDVILEKLLDGKRTGSAEVLTEKNLNDSKGMFSPLRNKDAYTGNINKIEEKRLSGDKTEDEKYEAAAKTPKKERWWDSLKKSASSGNAIVTAAPRNRSVRDEGSLDSLSPAQKFNMLPEFGITDEGGEGIAEDTGTESNEIVGSPEQQIDPVETAGEVEEATKGVNVLVNKEMPDDGLIVVKFSFDPLAYDNMDEIKQAALEKTLEIKPHLQDLIGVDDFSNPIVKGDDGTITLRLVGDQYFSNSGSGLFNDLSVETVDAGGTPTTIGRLQLGSDAIKLAKENREEFVKEATDFIMDSEPSIAEALKEFPDVSLANSLNFGLLDQGEITFVVGTPSPDAGGIELPAEDGNEPELEPELEPEVEETMPPATLAKSSLNFPIVVLAQSDENIKKNKKS